MNLTKQNNGKWRARYYDKYAGRYYAKTFALKSQAKAWAADQEAALAKGTHLDPTKGRVTFNQWADVWEAAHGGIRDTSRKQATTHLNLIRKTFGDTRLAGITHMAVKGWVTHLQAQGYADSTVQLVHRRLRQVLEDAVYEGLLNHNPIRRGSGPSGGKPKDYVATEDQIWALADAMPDHLRATILVGAFAGLRPSEICGLRRFDVDPMRKVISVQVQRITQTETPVKTIASKADVPIPDVLGDILAAHLATHDGHTVFQNTGGSPLTYSALWRAFNEARTKVDGLPDRCTLHDLRHFYVSALMASKVDIRHVQASVRHASLTTLDRYAHPWPGQEEVVRQVVGGMIRPKFGPGMSFPDTKAQ